ncbi:MAG: hypothetical protein E7509_00230 [Ruminococcus sp.]|nr:hypothetical protein [Ruminococcus sp.]
MKERIIKKLKELIMGILLLLIMGIVYVVPILFLFWPPFAEYALLVIKILVVIFWLFVLFRAVKVYISRYKDFVDFFSSKEKSFTGFWRMIDFKYIFLGIKTSPKINAQLIKTEATVIDKQEHIRERFDEEGNKFVDKIYDLKIRFYVGKESVTSFVHTEYYDKKVKILYNVDNPHEIYLQDSPEFAGKTKRENLNSAIINVFLLLLSMGVIVYYFV